MTSHDFPAVCRSAVETIGGTPMVALERLCAGLPGLVLVKLESFSPGASVKDRVARRMVEAAERSGELKPGGVIVETTSGNTGIGLAIMAAVRGYRFLAVMSEGNSPERRRMLRALGAEVVLVPQSGHQRPGIVTGEDLDRVEATAQKLAEEMSAFRPDQFANPNNAAVHEETTGEEIWGQTGGRVDLWVASVGTAGTFTGVARALKRHDPGIRCWAAEPASARMLAGCETTDAGHSIQGTGYNMVPPLWDASLCDGFMGVTDEDAVATARLLATREGIVAGYSGGANVWAALELARQAAQEAVIVTVCPDTGLKYLSSSLFP